MLVFTKDVSLYNCNIPFGYVAVSYPTELHIEAFRALVDSELKSLRNRYENYDRKSVFGDNPYVRFFKKFKKTYPVMMQFESVMFKGRTFPEYNPVAEVPFLMEIVTHVLSGAHDMDHLKGAVKLYSATDREEFPGLRGTPLHTYPGDFCGRDEEGIIFSLIAGADARTCAKLQSRNVFYPIFGTPDLPVDVIQDAMDILIRYIRVLAPDAAIQTGIL